MFRRSIVSATDVKVMGSGDKRSPAFRYRFRDQRTGKDISPWHDIPLEAVSSGGALGKVFNFICEIPANTRAKMEIATNEPGNPIKQDVFKKTGKLRKYAGPIYWNYGCLPQTWEDPAVVSSNLHGGAAGDNDPLDVVEISSSLPLPLLEGVAKGRSKRGAAKGILAPGSVTPVRVLGALGLLDQGELDWKLVAVRADHPLVTSGKLNDLADLEAVAPHVVNGMREWFRWYKVPDGKPLNEYAMGGRAIGRSDAEAVVEETHQHWSHLVNRKRQGTADGASGSELWVQ